VGLVRVVLVIVALFALAAFGGSWFDGHRNASAATAPSDGGQPVCTAGLAGSVYPATGGYGWVSGWKNGRYVFVFGRAVCLPSQGWYIVAG
jgi:hypothetical protein